ncbi:EAL domain-containing protein [Ciceribacter sp. RN22]|uniref:EAL domain-containing protein n=1 Tax=Ciceribacter sp. RN22 TaxID=2954932 RepID=UPI00209319ED|nr:EAL domain-containing protein [Ciceribacter sp. RN22]MCO6180932.1 EAL domain-containing protein [Ciceribacter sp. RN22]
MTITTAPSCCDTPCGRPDGGPEAVSLGFVAEPVVDLVHVHAAALYRECLLRVRFGRQMRLAPADFIPGLEASGHIRLLDAAMVALVLDALADDPQAVLGCNISPLTLASDASWRVIMQMIAGRASLAWRLVLEITESSPLDEIAEAPARLKAVQALGCRIAIDDFGAGSASIRHLHGINVDWDIIKIDRGCFSGSRSRTPSGRESLRSLFALAACLAPTIVVEGIETPRQLQRARAAGLCWGQGFLFSAPGPERWKELDGDAGDALRRVLLAYRPAGPEGRDEPVRAGTRITGAPGGPAIGQWLRSLFSPLSGRER